LQIVNDLTDDVLANESIAIAIASFMPERRHTGLLFRPEGEPWQLIHLGWHDDFKIEQPSQKYCAVKLSGIDPVILDGMADWLPQMLSANGGRMAYSIKPFDEHPFDTEGKVRFSQPGDGFTCATFLLWAFNHWNIPLISLDGWEDRPDDVQWREWIMQMLRETQDRYKIPEEHILAQAPYVAHAARFRPEEVAGAGGEREGRPSTFPEAVRKGQAVLEGMDRLGRLVK
jgi:hypothetical protein